MLVVSNLNYASPMTVAFQRLSVIFSDFVLMIGIIMWSETWSTTRVTECAHSRGKFAIVAGLTFLNPGLLMVDHIHFQYNGMLWGFSSSPLPVAWKKIARSLHVLCATSRQTHIFLRRACVWYLSPRTLLLGCSAFVTSRQLQRCASWRSHKAQSSIKTAGQERLQYSASEGKR